MDYLVLIQGAELSTYRAELTLLMVLRGKFTHDYWLLDGRPITEKNDKTDDNGHLAYTQEVNRLRICATLPCRQAMMRM